MNIQALMKQAQSMQKDMQKVEEEIENTEFLNQNIKDKIFNYFGIKNIKKTQKFLILQMIILKKKT